MCDIGDVYDTSCIFFLFWRLPSREAAKTGGKKIKLRSPPGPHIFVG
jgi:hypothetical protein